MNLYVIGYDISDSKRLVRMHRYLVAFAAPVQRSIFLLWGSEEYKDKCLQSAKHHLNEKQDSLYCCKLPDYGKKIHLGAQTLPDGVYFPPLKFSLI